MAKLVMKLNDEVIDHIELRQGDMKIGRKPGCDIVIDNLAVSGEHANIFTIGDDSFVQDLGSTNGTYINNKRITKHHLRNGDSLAIGKHTLVYFAESAPQTDDGLAKTVLMRPPAEAEPAPQDASDYNGRIASLVMLSGSKSGQRIELGKSVTNLGKTGQRAATISRKDDGYWLSGRGQEAPPKLNGRAIGGESVRLRNGDVIEVAGTRLQFLL